MDTVKVITCNSEVPALKAMQLPHPRLTRHLFSGPKQVQEKSNDPEVPTPGGSPGSDNPSSSPI